MRPMGLGLTIMAFILVLGVHPVENHGRIYQPTVGGGTGGYIAALICLDAPLLGVPSCFWYPAVLFRSQKTPSVEHPVRPQVARTLSVTATAYNCVAGQTDSTPQITASGRPCGHPHLAVSRDMLRFLPFGTRVRVGDQEFIVADTMHRRWRNRIDLPFPSRGDAIRFGVREMKLEVLK